MNHDLSVTMNYKDRDAKLKGYNHLLKSTKMESVSLFVNTFAKILAKDVTE